MKTARKGAFVIFLLVTAVLLSSCGGLLKATVYVQPVTQSIENVKVNDEPVSYPGSFVEVSKIGRILVTWEYESSYESETISGFDAVDGAVWTVYAGYVEY